MLQGGEGGGDSVHLLRESTGQRSRSARGTPIPHQPIYKYYDRPFPTSIIISFTSPSSDRFPSTLLCSGWPTNPNCNCISPTVILVGVDHQCDRPLGRWRGVAAVGALSDMDCHHSNSFGQLRSHDSLPSSIYRHSDPIAPVLKGRIAVKSCTCTTPCIPGDCAHIHLTGIR